jgi:hypothetical protein
MRRRDILKHSAALAGSALCLRGSAGAAAAATPTDVVSLADGATVRQAWVSRLLRVTEPVLTALAAGTLRRDMPVEGVPDRRSVTHLEAFGRTMAGLAPWLEAADDQAADAAARRRLGGLALQALQGATDPQSPDALNFTEGAQPLVDAAFLAHALVRAPRALLAALDAPTRTRVVEALVATRRITPYFSNWLLFSAMVEAALHRAGAAADLMRVDYAVRQHAQWYVGDGVYGDGPAYHCDYYNSFVIHPMLLDVLEVFGDTRPEWKQLRAAAGPRAGRFAEILERSIAPDGSFPPVGRSLAYRCGAFQLLAQVALRRTLPEEIAPAQARAALTAVIMRTLDAPGTFDDRGWLRIGLCGHQPGIGERYISTGSVYLCATAFLPLGLPSTDPFWVGPGASWTARRAWSGEAFPIDGALKEPAR